VNIRVNQWQKKGAIMTPYRGIIQITCKRKSGCLKNLKVSDVQPGCMDCPEAISQILDLEGKVIYEYKSPEVKTGKRKSR
jgi:hypothetical protein